MRHDRKYSVKIKNQPWGTVMGRDVSDALLTMVRRNGYKYVDEYLRGEEIYIGDIEITLTADLEALD